MKSGLSFAVAGLLLCMASAAAAESEMELCQSTAENTVIRAANCDLAIRLGGLSKEEMIVALYNRGQSALVAEQADKAVADFDAVLKLNPDDKGALLGRAISRRQLKQFDGSLADFDALLAQNNSQPDAKMYLQRSMTLYMAGNKQKSLADLRRAKELDPADPAIADRLWKTERLIEQEGK
ncbi:MAG: tetratricopeptide repeat protein [Alphaproteobacteria bacterium]|nr:tetratricopeptide repeat protein [Alphaproteobacteria bacterium]